MEIPDTFLNVFISAFIFRVGFSTDTRKSDFYDMH